MLPGPCDVSLKRPGPHDAEHALPKRNYGFEKRQKELNKQKKREEKQQRKLERKEATEDRPADAPEGNGPDGPQ